MSTETELLEGQVEGLGFKNAGHSTRIKMYKLVNEEIIMMGPSLARKSIGTLKISW